MGELETAQGIALDAQNENLYVSLHNGTVKKFNFEVETTDEVKNFEAGEIFVLGCKPHGYGK